MLGSFSHTPKTIGLVWQSSPRGLLLVALLTVVSAALPVAIAWVGKLIVDAVVAAHDATPGPAREVAYSHVIQWVLLELGIVISLRLVEQSIEVMRQLVGSRLGIDVNVTILESADP